MKDYAVILFKNNTAIKKRIKNPQKNFEVSYVVDGNKTSCKYEYDRESSIKIPVFLKLRQRMSFYEEGNPKPLSPDFKSPPVDMKLINAMVNSDLVSSLVNTTKDKARQMSLTIVLGIAGIIGLVLIVIFG